jgi:sugar/nucleoside kinase (ribokinase family)
MLIVTLGDVMLDIVVETTEPLRLDDDTNASITLSSGGQAANVAAWAVALGAEAAVIGPRGRSPAANLVAERLAAARVAYIGIDDGDVGTVVSVVGGGTRTMASDAGSPDWVRAVSAGHLPSGADALHVSGYPLLRAADLGPVIALVAAARSGGARVSVDLASAAMLADFGAAAFASTVDSLVPDVVFANHDEWRAVEPHWDRRDMVIVVKDGPRDVTVVGVDGHEDKHRVVPTEVVDATGAGDALAAGFLVGGIELGIEAAARCVASRGAQPG